MHLYQLLQLHLVQATGEQREGVAAGTLHQHLLLQVHLQVEGRRQCYILLQGNARGTSVGRVLVAFKLVGRTGRNVCCSTVTNALSRMLHARRLTCRGKVCLMLQDDLRCMHCCCVQGLVHAAAGMAHLPCLVLVVKGAANAKYDEGSSCTFGTCEVASGDGQQVPAGPNTRALVARARSGHSHQQYQLCHAPLLSDVAVGVLRAARTAQFA